MAWKEMRSSAVNRKSSMIVEVITLLYILSASPDLPSLIVSSSSR